MGSILFKRMQKTTSKFHKWINQREETNTPEVPD